MHYWPAFTSEARVLQVLGLFHYPLTRLGSRWPEKLYRTCNQNTTIVNLLKCRFLFSSLDECNGEVRRKSRGGSVDDDEDRSCSSSSSAADSPSTPSSFKPDNNDGSAVVTKVEKQSQPLAQAECNNVDSSSVSAAVIASSLSSSSSQTSSSTFRQRCILGRIQPHQRLAVDLQDVELPCYPAGRPVTPPPTSTLAETVDRAVGRFLAAFDSPQFGFHVVLVVLASAAACASDARPLIVILAVAVISLLSFAVADFFESGQGRGLLRRMSSRRRRRQLWTQKLTKKRTQEEELNNNTRPTQTPLKDIFYKVWAYH